MKAINWLSLDCETTGLLFQEHEVVELAAVAYNGETMEPFPPEEGGEFHSLMRPLRPETIDDNALRVNGLTRERLAGAPHPKAVWARFEAWVRQWNPKGGVTTAPIAAGKNIRNFDLKFIAKLNQEWGSKKEKTVLFNRREQYDLEDFIRNWFWFDHELESMSMDRLRDHFGMSKENSHTALQDAAQTGKMIAFFLKLTRDLRSKTVVGGKPLIDFKAAFRGL